ncbi:MAG: HAMP domain-containing sensor histidine kinase [Actinomycetota bacterium]
MTAPNAATAPPDRGSRRRLGLRRRVVAGFAGGALLLSASLAVITYQFARTYLLDQREASVLGRSQAAAGLVATELYAAAPDIPRLLSALVVPAGSHPVVLHENRWFASTLQVGRDDIPADVRERAAAGDAVLRLFRLRDEPHLAVGLPLAGEAGAYFEVASLDDLDRTLRVLRNALGAAALITTLGGVGVGVWAGGRLLRPLTEAAQAAAAVGAGSLDVRLRSTGDADLDTLSDAFNAMTAALGERIERDARFASAVSHELRSPLTTLSTSVQLLEARRDDLPERARRALDLLAGDVRRFQRLVEDLLEMSRIRAGAAEVTLEVVRPDELVAHALRSAQAAGVPVHVEPAAGDLLVRVDKRRLERVIVNLVENAQTHGGGVVRMSIEARPGGVLLAVEDAGPGVGPEDRDRIFEPFVRGRAAGRRGNAEGTGLGLSLVAEHVRLHEGRVYAAERPGGGARFVVELPEAER